MTDLNALQSSKPTEEYVCPDCKEWTNTNDPCCNTGPADSDPDIDMER